ncbi:AAA family ATPase [Flavobacterium sp. LHD-80]|uniref:AAA family ATPase n=1 Tax=Flavobacterium sp. LHD-80 TaxID=3071411 RepID=UPI0027E01B19|nr:AAA family ATPase [Flavobacterium sp. LHD-80]MDQ6469076.1 AAA family ATPase [Flavobacterium sp. LHD-80]
MNNKHTAYISRFYIENIKCFQGKNNFDLLDENGNIVQWTVILGNNNSGKTNILKSIADLEPTLLSFGDKKNEQETKNYAPLNLMRGLREKPKNLKEAEAENSFIGCDILYKKRSSSKSPFTGKFSLYGQEEIRENNLPKWGFTPNRMWNSRDSDILNDLKIYGYGVTRRTGKKGIAENDDNYNSATLFNPEMSLINIEDWLFQLDYASKNNQKAGTENLSKIKTLIKSGIFPDIFDFKFDSSENLKNNILFKTKSGWNKLQDLGYGYQTTLSWIIDLCKKMFERYPRSINPLEEPSIVLVDEIDLHLHPSWQKNVVKFLSEIFPATQFIVTSHSPLVIQSLDKLNLFVLSSNENGVSVNKSKKNTFKGWSVEEILQDVMDLENGNYSDLYNNYFLEFDKALDDNNFEKASSIYKNLDKILHPNSADRKILKLQLSQLIGNDKT